MNGVHDMGGMEASEGRARGQRADVPRRLEGRVLAMSLRYDRG